MSVRIIKADHPLPPLMLPDRVNISDLQARQPLEKGIKIFLFKIEFPGVSPAPLYRCR